MRSTMEPQAQAFYNVLEAIFDYCDTQLEPKCLGVVTLEKSMVMMEKVIPADMLAVYRILPMSVYLEQYKIMGCQVVLYPSYDPAASEYDFRQPDQPALTKAGYIKSEIIGMLSKDNQHSYDTLQGYISNFDIQIKDPIDRSRFPGGRYMALPEKSTVEWYASSLASALGITVGPEIYDRMLENLQAWSESLKPQPAPELEPEPKQVGITEEQFAREAAEMLAQQREIELLNMATRMADAQTRRMMESKILEPH